MKSCSLPAASKQICLGNPVIKIMHAISLLLSLPLVLVGLGMAESLTPAAELPGFHSAWMAVDFAESAPAFACLSVDSLGQNKAITNPVFKAKLPVGPLELVWKNGDHCAYVIHTAAGLSAELWEMELTQRRILLRSHHVAGAPALPFTLVVDQSKNHATMLGVMSSGEQRVILPAVLHFPDLGSIRISANVPGTKLDYDARRLRPENFVQVEFPPASSQQVQVEYILEVAAIHPDLPSLAQDARFDGFRRNWLNILQLNPRLRVLANHSSSDTCAFCLYEYADIARHTPPLAPGLSALDVLRQTLDGYLGGTLGYGMPGYVMFDAGPSNLPAKPPACLDTYPSLLIAAGDFFRGTGDEVWLKHNYSGIRKWAEALLALDRNGNGLFEYGHSGNSGSWSQDKNEHRSPANWWDTIGFGHEDAYANALAFRALGEMENLARRLKLPDDAARFGAAAERLRAAYYPTFFNPATGVLAGWKSADGKLHDYWFTFVNGIAVAYGLVPPDQANPIMDRVLAKMRTVGYTNFVLGLPGNLVPIAKDDYTNPEHRWGGGQKPDGSDAFQIYENGGATACFSYFTLAALYHLGRIEDADRMLLPMLEGFARGGFQGGGTNGMSNDWRAWDGTPWGYEGFLVDNYYALLAVLDRHQAIAARKINTPAGAQWLKPPNLFPDKDMMSSPPEAFPEFKVANRGMSSDIATGGGSPRSR